MLKKRHRAFETSSVDGKCADSAGSILGVESFPPAAELLSVALGFLISFVGEMSGLTLMTFGSFHLTEFLSTVGGLVTLQPGDCSV